MGAMDLPVAAVPPADANAAAAAAGAEWALLVARLSRNLERGGKQWTGARRKDSLQRVLNGSRSDPQRLLQRLQSLMTAWEGDDPADFSHAVSDPAQSPAPIGGSVERSGGPAAESSVEASAETKNALPAAVASTHAAAPDAAWQPVLAAWQGAVVAGLPADQPDAAALADRLAAVAGRLAADGPTPTLGAEVQDLCRQARRLYAHRHHLVDELASLCRELGAGLTELAEDDSWARGQCQNLEARLADGLSVRGVRAAGAVLADTRQHQQRVRGQRQTARDELRQLIHDMVQQVGELGAETGRFELATVAHAEAIETADTLEGLAEVVKAMLADTRAVQKVVSQSHERLAVDQARAVGLEGKVRELEAELRRLSEEVSTDALTQVANRRGLAQAFEAESARCLREGAGGAPEGEAGGQPGGGLAVALIDIDNFKKLNDSLGHAAGDQALQSLAAAVRERLRPVDHLARFGGEEFVVLLPGATLDAAEQALTRLQRSLTQSLFLHDGHEVFVTFSAGVTAWRAGEALQDALDRADEAMYEAKRTGKNRTCTA